MKNRIPALALTGLGKLALATALAFVSVSVSLAQAKPAVAVVAPVSPAPRISLGLYGISPKRVFVGWPLIFTASATHPEAPSDDPSLKPILLASEKGPWALSCKLTITGSAGKQAPCPVHAAFAENSKAFALDGKMAGRAVWWISPEETSALAPGIYTIDLVFDTSKLDEKKAGVPTAWKGTVRTDMKLEIVKEPSELTPALLESRALLKANLAMIRHDSALAMVEVEALLKSQPKSVRGLTTKGDLLAEQNKFVEAASAYEAAITLFGKGKEPPVQILNRYDQILSKIHPATRKIGQ